MLRRFLNMMYVVNCDIMMRHNDIYVGWKRYCDFYEGLLCSLSPGISCCQVIINDY